ncbi:hypothetical protein M5689_013557 [Euphorbia peplus]|nr:hypothetical protein M5689_013557 [Euphorbia peplus]
MAASKSQKSMSPPPLPQPASSMDIISSSGSASASSASAAVGGAAGGSGVIPGASALTYTPQECFYCLTPCASFRRGWKIRNGKFAALCFTCS